MFHKKKTLMVEGCQLTYHETCSHAFVVMRGREPSNSARKPQRTAFASGDQTNFNPDRILAKHSSKHIFDAFDYVALAGIGRPGDDI